MSSKRPKFKQHASNYNYKGKRSFGQRIKNFFTIPEEDLKEEPSKEFEKIKLFTLTRGSLFLGILVFMILINILVGFNINFLYLRQIFGFLFLILIPGLLIMLCFKIRTVKFWEYLVYTVGLSIAFIMFAGLAVNWTLPALGITDRPLSLWPILICFDIFLLGLWLTAIYRNKDLKPFDITIPKLDTINRIFFIIPMFFPLLSILGAFLLNNHGPNILTMIMLGGIAIYVLFITIFRKRMNENVWPWALYWIGLSLLLMYSMRSWFFMGNDVVTEYRYFNLIIQEGFWDINKYSNAYNACLSVNIFPNILGLFIEINQLIIFKLIIQILSPVMLIIIYLFFKKFLKKFISFLSGFFFLSQVGYLIDMPSHIRQEIAFLFFGLMFLVLFTSYVNKNIKKLLFVIFGASMIVSHYSTAYIALALFTLTYMFIVIYKIYEKNKIKKGKIYSWQKSEFYLTGSLVLLLLLFGFLWYNQVTPTGSGLVKFMDKSISNFNDLFNQDFQTQGHSFLDQFSIKSRDKDYLSILNKQIDDIKLSNISNTYSNIETQSSSLKFIAPLTLPSKISYRLASILYTLLSFIKRFGYLFIFIGLSSSIIYAKIKKNSEIFLISLIGFISLFFVILTTIVPFGSISYGVLRLYQQGLIILSVFGIIGAYFVFKIINKKHIHIFIIFFLIIYFFSFVGFFNQIIGYNLAFSNLNNKGIAYDTEYLSKTEIDSIKWMSNFNLKNNLYAGSRYNGPFVTFGNLPYPNINVFSQLLTKNSYVYAGNPEVLQSIAFIHLEGTFISYNFPTEFLNDNKNKIYNNGGSEIFK